MSDAFICGDTALTCFWKAAYGKSTLRFFAPSITSTLGRGGAIGGFSIFKLAVVTVGRGLLRRTTGAGLAFAPKPGSGTGIARSPESNEALLAPGVASSF